MKLIMYYCVFGDQVIGWYAAALCESYPYLAESGLIDALIPKKETLHIAKWYVSYE